ncbi:hypothetical protein Q4S45_07140 [Massilia sp. R2A-15]|nr:hypothetical protein [Massilia sp. R2A-15]WLI90884.1 hypothetical protein Q4S45_07140 [Massilia sp. R2A-15]
MTEWVSKFLQNEERSRNLIASIGFWGGVILSVLAILNTFLAK